MEDRKIANIIGVNTENLFTKINIVLPEVIVNETEYTNIDLMKDILIYCSMMPKKNPTGLIIPKDIRISDINKDVNALFFLREDNVVIQIISDLEKEDQIGNDDSIMHILSKHESGSKYDEFHIFPTIDDIPIESSENFIIECLEDAFRLYDEARVKKQKHYSES